MEYAMSGLFGPRLAALFGVAFAVLMFLATAALEVPHNVSAYEVTRWWSDEANQRMALFSMTADALAAIAFCLFLSFLRDRLNVGGGTAGNPMYTVGLAFAAGLLATAAARGVIANALMNGETMPLPDTLRYFPELAYAFMEVSLMAAGACILLASWAIKKTAALPAWTAWVGFVTGAATMVGVLVIGSFVIPIVLVWALAMSVAVWRSGSTVAAPELRQASQPA
jgi:hypothetical protein